MSDTDLSIVNGSPFPYGTDLTPEGVNFALFSKHATKVTLCLYDKDKKPIREIPLDPQLNRTGEVWHIRVNHLPDVFIYGYRLDGPKEPEGRFFYDYDNVVLDPYAKILSSSNEWGKEAPDSYHPLGVVIQNQHFDWENVGKPNLHMKDLIVYEMHIRAFTQHNSSGVQHPGTYLGVIEKIPYLLDMGINAVEIMPPFEFYEMSCLFKNPITQEPLKNFWGYSTVSFFSPMNRYAASKELGAAVNEFKQMVKELHKHGIEVILDVVFNHTAEGSEAGPSYSFKGIDCPVYYMINAENHFANYTGCGNTFNCNHPVVIDFIIDCMRYWVIDYQIDGFRFDLASIFKRDMNGAPVVNAPVIEAMSHDPILSKTKLIAEPWDAAGLYHVGAFEPFTDRWSEWNGKYRDRVRKFIKGTPGIRGKFATALSGCPDIYPKRAPYCSQNFVTVHDGFTLRDLVSYNEKHNDANGENNNDGSNVNESWNCGFEGETQDPNIIWLRSRQMKNHLLALMVSQGSPLVLMGDEYGHTKNGNNNTWAQDNDLNWFLWNHIDQNREFIRFFKLIVQFRKQNALLRSDKFLVGEQIIWHGRTPLSADWNKENHFVACTLADPNHEDIYLAFNADHITCDVILPDPPEGKKWHLIAYTGNRSPQDIYEEKDAPVIENLNFFMDTYTSLIVKAK